MKKAAVPIVRSGDAGVDKFAEAVKQQLDGLTGQARNSTKILPLDPATATAADCARQLNLILERVQGS